MSEILVEAPVTRVVFLEDRAQVFREVRLHLPEGPSRLRISAISPVTADSSLLVRAEGARVDEARVARRWKIGQEEQPDRVASLSRTLEDLKRARSLTHARKQCEESRRARLEQAAGLRAESIGIEMPRAVSFLESWRQELESLEAEARRSEDVVAALSVESADLESKIAVVEAKVREESLLGAILEAALVVDVTAERAAEAVLLVQYIVPCALWRPMHRASLTGDELEFSSGAAVWQATGEDWHDIEVAFSTARPSRQAEPPALSDDLLSVRKRMEKAIHVGVREQVISTTGEGQELILDEVPGVDDGGESRLLSSPMRFSLRSDGRMSWIPLFAFSAKVQTDRICRPEKLTAVLRRTLQPNGSSFPLLAGPVELIRNQGFAGISDVGFVAAGERFVLSWGPDEALRVQRQKEEIRETARLTGRLTVSRTVRIFASNLENRAAEFVLEERIPVSEIEDVTVEILEKDSTPGLKADENGIVRKTVELPSQKSETILLKYRLSAPSSIQGL